MLGSPELEDQGSHRLLSKAKRLPMSKARRKTETLTPKTDELEMQIPPINT
jgi:hypothetical protein